MATCPECGADVEVENVEQGEIVPCPDCGAELEGRSTDPCELGLAPAARVLGAWRMVCVCHQAGRMLTARAKTSPMMASAVSVPD